MFPSTRVPRDKQKKKEWLEAWGNSIVNATGSGYSSRLQRLWSNRQAYYGKVDPLEFQYMTQMYGIRTPARFVGYPFIYKLVESLVGETSGDTLQFSVESVDDDIIASKLEKRVEAGTNVLTAPLRKILGGVSTEDLFAEEGVGNELPDNIAALDEMSFHDNTEVGMMYVMTHLQQKYDLDLIFEEGMREMAISYSAAYRVYVKNGDPVVETVNPSRLTFGNYEGLRWLQYAPWVRDENEVPISAVIDEYRHLLSIEDIAKFEKWMAGGNINTNSSNIPWQKWGRYDVETQQLLLRVVRWEFMSIDEMVMKESYNKYAPDMPFLKIMPSHVEPKGKDLKYRPINMVMNGVMIAGKHYGCGERPDQVRENDNYAQTHLSYFGCVRDGISIVDATKELSNMMCVTMYHIEAMLNRAGGRAVVYDLAQKPKNIPLEDIFYHGKEGGIIFINTREEGSQLSRGFNQFQQIDFTLSSSIDQLYRLKMMLEDTMSSITGINPNRTGEGHHDETAKNNNSKIQQSSYITQSMFDDHFKVAQDVLNELLNLVRIAWNDNNERVLTVFGDRGRETIKLMKDWLGHHYGLYVKNSQKERLKKQNILRMGEQALSAGQVGFEHLLTMGNKSNSKEIERVFKKSMAIMKKESAANAQAQLQSAEADRQLKRDEIQSRIIAARIEAGAYVETKRMEIAAQYDLADKQSMTQLATVAEESRASLDQIVEEAKVKSSEEMAAMQPQAQTTEAGPIAQ